MAICPAAALGMSWGTVKGETRSGPLVCSTFSLASRELIPPMPVANSTPVSSLSTLPSIPESCQASRAAVMASQYALTPIPTGVTAPIPVTTTRRTFLPHCRLLGDHQVGRFADGLDASDLVVRDLDAELLFEGQDDLDQVE